MSSKSCVACHDKSVDVDQQEGLCGSCYRSSPRMSCSTCMKRFSAWSEQLSSDKRCQKCVDDYTQYGDPRPCEICHALAAFGTDTKCRHCTRSLERFGSPVECEMCRNMCAFRKSSKALDKVDGKVLCYGCTYKYKADKAQNKSPAKDQKDESRINRKRRHSHKGASEQQQHEQQKQAKRARSDSADAKSPNKSPHSAAAAAAPTGSAATPPQMPAPMQLDGSGPMPSAQPEPEGSVPMPIDGLMRWSIGGPVHMPMPMPMPMPMGGGPNGGFGPLSIEGLMLGGPVPMPMQNGRPAPLPIVPLEFARAMVMSGAWPAPATEQNSLIPIPFHFPMPRARYARA